MKKILLLSITAALALGANATPLEANVPSIEGIGILKADQMTEARTEAATSFMTLPEMKRAAALTDAATAVPGTLYRIPDGSFYIGLSSNMYSFNYQHYYMPAYTDLTFTDITSQAKTRQWSYYAPEDYEGDELPDPRTSSDSLLNMSFDITNGSYAPVLYASNEIGDSTYADSTYVRAGTAPYVSETGGTFLCCHYDIQNWPSVYNSSGRAYKFTGFSNVGTNQESTNSLFKNWLASDGVSADTVYVRGYGDINFKPESPYLLSSVYTYGWYNTSGNVTLEIYKAVIDEDGEYELGDLLCSKTVAVEGDESTTQMIAFTDLTATDPETGLEGELIVDDAIITILKADENVEYFPAFRTDPKGTYLPAHNIEYMEVGSEEKTPTIRNWRLNGSAFSCLDFGFHYELEFSVLTSPQATDREITFQVPAEGGEYSFDVLSYYTHSAWDVLTTDGDDLPEWIGWQEPVDSTYEYDGSTYFTGDVKCSLKVEALPEGTDSRTCDFYLKYNAAKITVHVIQPEQDELLGDVNLDGRVDAGDIACIVNIITGKDAAGTYGTRDDVNKDGQVNSGDIAALVAIITGGSN